MNLMGVRDSWDRRQGPQPAAQPTTCKDPWNRRCVGVSDNWQTTVDRSDSQSAVKQSAAQGTVRPHRACRSQCFKKAISTNTYLSIIPHALLNTPHL